MKVFKDIQSLYKYFSQNGNELEIFGDQIVLENHFFPVEDRAFML